MELLKMLDVHRYGLAAGYATASVVLGYASVQLATAVARRVQVSGVSPLEWAAVGAIGGASALARFVVDGIIATRVGSDFPAGTLAVNASGALLLGLLTGLALSGESLLLAGTASIGSYTTFSTRMLETQRLNEAGDQINAGANLLVSIGAGLGAAAVGRLIGSHL